MNVTGFTAKKKFNYVSKTDPGFTPVTDIIVIITNAPTILMLLQKRLAGSALYSLESSTTGKSRFV